MSEGEDLETGTRGPEPIIVDSSRRLFWTGQVMDMLRSYEDDRLYFLRRVDELNLKLIQTVARPRGPDFREGCELFVLKDASSEKCAAVELGLEYKRIDFDNGYTYGDLDIEGYGANELTDELLELFVAYCSQEMFARTSWGVKRLVTTSSEGLEIGVYLPRRRKKGWSWLDFIGSWPPGEADR